MTWPFSPTSVKVLACTLLYSALVVTCVPYMKPSNGPVLVLGSGGLIGRHLVKVCWWFCIVKILFFSHSISVVALVSFSNNPPLHPKLQELHQEGFEVLEVKNRRHVDLRITGALDQFSDKGIQMVYFLACEVGGSKFLDSSEGDVQLAIIRHNLQIYETVFGWLRTTRIPFIFTSSYLQFQPTSYGSIKRLGELYVEGMFPFVCFVVVVYCLYHKRLLV